MIDYLIGEKQKATDTKSRMNEEKITVKLKLMLSVCNFFLIK